MKTESRIFKTTEGRKMINMLVHGYYWFQAKPMTDGFIEITIKKSEPWPQRKFTKYNFGYE